MYTSWVCDQCGRCCRSGDAFCSTKCVEHYEDEQLQTAYNGPKSNTHMGDSAHWGSKWSRNSPVRSSYGAD